MSGASVILPFAALLLGGPGETPQDYLATTYAMFSQSTGTVFVLATALILMALLVGDLLAEADRRLNTDPLSGLLNRRGFEERLAELVAAHEFGGSPLSLVYCRLDRFKEINDTFGHAAGDRVIERYAAHLRKASSGAHAIGRIGGEENAVALVHCNAATAKLFAEASVPPSPKWRSGVFLRSAALPPASAWRVWSGAKPPRN